MAVRGSVTLLFILLSGIVHANDLVTSPLPETAEPSTIKLASVMQTTTAPPTTSEHSSATTHGVAEDGVTSEAPDVKQSKTTSSATGSQAITELPTTTHHHTTNSTTEPPTTTHHNTTNSTTEPPTTTHHNTTNSTTEPPTTTHHNTTNSTTEPPTTTHHNTTNSTTEPPTTTHHNTTNSTTEAPTTPQTNATTAPTAAPTATPTTPPVPNPTPGNYSVKSDNVTVCLLAKMGLQFSFKNGNDRIQTLNLDPSPSVTEVSGTCGGGGNDSSLVLKSKEITVQFVFTNVSDKFHLHSLNFSVDFGNGSVFSDSNYNLSLWEATVGSSYMCKKEQRYNITDKLTVNTFQLQVQPFAVQKNMFSTAEECFLDSDLSFLVPIAVGVALSFLIILVLISYLIGRRKSRTGYQSV